jgi:tetratricopeptide (TPR) repeat protein
MGSSSSGTNGDGKIIHVQFGRRKGRAGRGRTRDGSPNAARASRGKRERPPAVVVPTPEIKPLEPTKDVYTRLEVQKLLGATTARLRSLERHAVVVPSGKKGARRAYTFQDLIALRAALGLLAQGVKLGEVVRSVQALRLQLPRVKKPLLELKIAGNGRKVVVRSAEGTFEPKTGQMVLDFDVRALNEDVVRVLRPAVKQHRARAAFEIYRRASELDEDPKTMEEAARLYRQAVDLDPQLAIAYTNLGNILFRKGDETSAEALYLKALAIDGGQPEAKYNLGYLMLERHELDDAIRYFQGAIEADPRFADAYFNLAMAYEELGDRRNARPLWRTYLELEPTGTWADIARQHLG